LGDGTAQRCFDLHISLLYSRREQRTGQLVVLRDITEHKQALEALRASEASHRALLVAAQRQAQEAALLDQVRAALARELDLPTVLKTIVEAIASTFGYTQVSLYMLMNSELVLQHQVGYERIISHIQLNQGA
jgi:PAS domain-containing protein